MFFLPEISSWSLEELTASSKAQTPLQDYRDHEESGKHDTTKGTQWTYNNWPWRNGNQQIDSQRTQNNCSQEVIKATRETEKMI